MLTIVNLNLFKKAISEEKNPLYKYTGKRIIFIYERTGIEYFNVGSFRSDK